MSIVACPTCGDPAAPKKATGPVPVYCSLSCRRKAQHLLRNADGRNADLLRRQRDARVPVVHSCESCGSRFESSHARSRFCKAVCRVKWFDENNPVKCSVVGCSVGVRSLGLCHLHHKQQKRREGVTGYNSPWDERRKANSHKRRALKLGTQVEDIRPIDIYERDIWLCGLCVTPVDPDVSYPDPMSASLDHVIPLSKGGAHTYENVQLAHLTCNLSKGAKLVA